MTIKIALTNLGKYNEGELVYEWLTLPFFDNELDEVLEKIGIDGVNYEEYFISDYEAPFKINEYTNIHKLNEMIEHVDINFSDFMQDTYLIDINSIINLANTLGYEEVVDDFIHNEDINDFINGRDWQSIKITLSGVHSLNDEYYKINGYGNLESITANDKDNTIQEIFKRLMSEYDL